MQKKEKKKKERWFEKYIKGYICVCKKYESFPLMVVWNGSKILRGKKKSRERTKKRDDKNKENYFLGHN